MYPLDKLPEQIEIRSHTDGEFYFRVRFMIKNIEILGVDPEGLVVRGQSDTGNWYRGSVSTREWCYWMVYNTPQEKFIPTPIIVAAQNRCWQKEIAK